MCDANNYCSSLFCVFWLPFSSWESVCIEANLTGFCKSNFRGQCARYLRELESGGFSHVCMVSHSVQSTTFSHLVFYSIFTITLWGWYCSSHSAVFPFNRRNDKSSSAVPRLYICSPWLIWELDSGIYLKALFQQSSIYNVSGVLN